MADLDKVGIGMMLVTGAVAGISVALFVFVGLSRARATLNRRIGTYTDSLERSEKRMARLHQVGQGNTHVVWAARALKMRAFSLPTALVLVGASVVTALLDRLALSVYLLGVFVLLPFIFARVVDWAESRSRRRIERALPSAISIIASSLAAGLGMQAAMTSVATNLKGPITNLARGAANAMASGRGTKASLLDMAAASGSRYVSLFVHVANVHVERGGNLAQALRELGGALTLIHIAEDDLKAKTAGARREALYAMVIVPATLLLGIVFLPDLFGKLTSTRSGNAILVIAMAGIAFCVYKLRMITDREV